MSEKIKVNTNRLGADADSVRASIAKMQQSMKSLKNDAAKLNAMWTGATSDTFKKVFEDDMNALSTMISNLDKIYSFETNAKTKYETCEKKVSSLVSGMRV